MGWSYSTPRCGDSLRKMACFLQLVGVPPSPAARRAHLERLSASTVPATLFQNHSRSLNIRAWEEMRRYFQSVAHHRHVAGEHQFRENNRCAWKAFSSRDCVPARLTTLLRSMHFWKRGLRMPNSDTLKRALELIRKRTVNHDYFFSKLVSPDWIEPLDKAGLFSCPPSAIREGDTIRFPSWPESEYLARMAPEAPEQVATVMMKIPQTDNERIHTDLAEAATRLPADLAARWAKKESQWVSERGRLYLSLPRALGELAAYLAKEGQIQASMRLAGVLLEVRLDGEQAYARFDSWHYKQVLQKHIPELVQRTCLEGLAFLCELLERALTSDPDGDEGIEDYSWIWRPAIEPHEQNHRQGDLRDALVDSIRDGSLRLIESGVPIESVLSRLQERRRPIFKRIAIHLLAERSTEHFQPAVEATVNKENFYDLSLWHEYSRLLSVVFPELDASKKALLLEWTEIGPPYRTLEHKSEESRRPRIANWQLRRLAPVRRHLPSNWNERYTKLVSEFAEPSHPDFDYYSAISSGPGSPIEARELEGMSTEDISAFLKTWQPSDEWDQPKPRELGRTLQQVVGKSPDRFVASLDSFRDVEPTYASALVQGLYDAVKREVPIKWEKVVDYLQWVVEQPRTVPGMVGDSFDRDPHWGWARREVAVLLSGGFGKDTIDYSLREAVWRILDRIAEDPDPTLEDDETSSLDPYAHSINTTRGQALHTVVPYALWVRRRMEDAGSNDERFRLNMDCMPEVRTRLERHLCVEYEPSSAIRAVYGRWFPWLVLLDSDWAAANIETIFPADQPFLRDAAWNSYIMHCPAYDEPFRLLRRQYEAAVEQLSTSAEKDSGTQNSPNGRLGEHLVFLLGRGVVSWADDDGLVRRFFENAPPTDAAQAIRSIGHLLDREHKDIPTENLERFRLFWGELLNFTLDIGESHTEILEPYSLWFASKRFDAEWAFDQLERVIVATKGFDLASMVIRAIVELCADLPMQSLSALRALVLHDERRWGIYGSEDNIRTILTAGIDNDSTKSDTVALINILGARGHLEFRDLVTDAL